MHTLFLGNGLNLLGGYNSWNDILNSISNGHLIENIPNTLQYENIILQKEYNTHLNYVLSDGNYFITADGCRLQVKENTELTIKCEIAQELNVIDSTPYYQKFINLPFENIITTNYDNAVSKTLELLGYQSVLCDTSERIYSIRRKETFQKDNVNKTLWKIHGDIDHPISIMLGFDHYCGSIGKIDDYLKGNYKHVYNKTILQRLNEGITQISSWIDLFFISDISIVGLGLDFSENDLWWLLTRRKRLTRESYGGLFNNTITYYGPIDSGKKELLETLDVIVRDYERPKNNCYDVLYDKIIKEIINDQQNHLNKLS